MQSCAEARTARSARLQRRRARLSSVPTASRRAHRLGRRDARRPSAAGRPFHLATVSRVSFEEARLHASRRKPTSEEALLDVASHRVRHQRVNSCRSIPSPRKSAMRPFSGIRRLSTLEGFRSSQRIPAARAQPATLAAPRCSPGRHPPVPTHRTSTCRRPLLRSGVRELAGPDSRRDTDASSMRGRPVAAQESSPDGESDDRRSCPLMLIQPDESSPSDASIS